LSGSHSKGIASIDIGDSGGHDDSGTPSQQQGRLGECLSAERLAEPHCAVAEFFELRDGLLDFTGRLWLEGARPYSDSLQRNRGFHSD
jgi:hypothetical protein